MFNSIGDRVKKAMAERIKNAEEAHRQHCIQVDEEAKQRKEKHADEMVSNIIGR